MTIPGHELFAKRQGKTFEESAVEVVEALRSQAGRTKERLNKASRSVLSVGARPAEREHAEGLSVQIVHSFG